MWRVVGDKVDTRYGLSNANSMTFELRTVVGKKAICDDGCVGLSEGLLIVHTSSGDMVKMNDETKLLG